MRHIVRMLKNSSSLIHFFSTTTTSRDHAESPPPNEASEMWLKVNANSVSEGRDFAASLMMQLGIVREVVLVVLRGVQWIRCVVVV